MDTYKTISKTYSSQKQIPKPEKCSKSHSAQTSSQVETLKQKFKQISLYLDQASDSEFLKLEKIARISSEILNKSSTKSTNCANTESDPDLDSNGLKSEVLAKTESKNLSTEGSLSVETEPEHNGPQKPQGGVSALLCQKAQKYKESSMAKDTKHATIDLNKSSGKMITNFKVNVPFKKQAKTPKKQNGLLSKTLNQSVVDSSTLVTPKGKIPEFSLRPRPSLYKSKAHATPKPSNAPKLGIFSRKTSCKKVSTRYANLNHTTTMKRCSLRDVEPHSPLGKLIKSPSAERFRMRLREASQSLLRDKKGKEGLTQKKPTQKLAMKKSPSRPISGISYDPKKADFMHRNKRMMDEVKHRQKSRPKKSSKKVEKRVRFEEQGPKENQSMNISYRSTRGLKLKGMIEDLFKNTKNL